MDATQFAVCVTEKPPLAVAVNVFVPAVVGVYVKVCAVADVKTNDEGVNMPPAPPSASAIVVAADGVPLGVTAYAPLAMPTIVLCDGGASVKSVATETTRLSSVILSIVALPPPDELL